MFYNYIDNNPQMNLQINRQLENIKESQTVKDDLVHAIPKINDLNSWYNVWLDLANKREETHDYAIACAYFGLAQFYLTSEDDKQPIVHHYIENFYLSHPEIDYKYYEVPYQDSYLPAIKVNINPSATKTLIIINGFDSFMEEILSAITFFKGTNYNVILFDGPGQGRALIDNHIRFTSKFEKPVHAVIDYFGLTEVDAMGVSWGGYFVIRAAAFDKRIKNVICFDFFYDGLNVFLKDFTEKNKIQIRNLINQNKALELNTMINPLIKANSNSEFIFNKGYENTNTNDPFTLLKNISEHTIKGIGQLVTQNVLLLAGEEDQYVPFSDLKLEQQELSNATSLETKVFTKETGGEQHCQAGHYELALSTIQNFLEKHATN